MGRTERHSEERGGEPENRGKHGTVETGLKTGEKIWIGILAVLAVAVVLLCVFIGNLSPKQKALYKELTKLNNELSDAERTSSDLTKQLDELQHVDEYIVEIKAEAFDYLAQLEQLIQDGETDYRIAYLTFDDGPYARTRDYMELLDENNIQATFFTTSINGKYCYDDGDVETAPIYNLYVKYGHTIANHTYTHGLKSDLYSSTETFLKAIDDQQNYIESLTGVKTNICRFPGGKATAGSLQDSIVEGLRERGYAWVDWTANDGDGGNIKDRDKAREKFKDSFGDDPIEVVLFHDYNKATYELLPEFIEYARERNYIFAPLFHDSAALNR